MALRIDNSVAAPSAGETGPRPTPAAPCVFELLVVQDAEDYIQEVVESILGQTHRNIEVVVVDRGSGDSTPAILQAMAARDPRLRSLHLGPCGQAEARNAALRSLPDHACYVMSSDVGSVSDPETVAGMVAFLEQHADVDLVGCRSQLVDRDANPTDCLSPCIMVYRRSILERLGGYRTEYSGAEDYDLLARALQSGSRAEILADVRHPVRPPSPRSSRSRDLQRLRLETVITDRLRVTLPWRLAHREGRSAGLKLHLGCGEQYLDGYVNVDLDAGQHTVQEQHRRDLEEDIRGLVLPPGSCHEIRAHHVFEHFPRAQALRLLIEWHRWLVDGGALLLETPDLEHSLPSLQHNRSSAERSRVLRHLFGSQEAGWAFHLDAYDETRFRQVLTALGFAVEGVKHTQCHGLANVWVLARKMPMDRRQQMAAAGSLLDEAMVDGSAIERRLRGIWQEQLEGILQPSMSCALL